MSKSARFRFYAELNDFLPPDRRFQTIERTFDVAPTVKDMIEGIGIPHTEIDLVIVNDRSVDLSYRIEDGDLISVFPMFESFDISGLSQIQARPLRDPRFVVDANLGQLATYLRLLGFDCLYDRDFEDADLANISRTQRRALLTRDRELLKRSAVTHGYFVRSDDPRAQASEVLTRFDLFSLIRPFERCLRCNSLLEDVSKEEIEDRLQPRTKEHFEEFRRCPSCGRIYWEGSHYERMLAFVEEVRRRGHRR